MKKHDQSQNASKAGEKLQNIRQHLTKPVVLVGLMGAGKTQLGRMLAAALDKPFVDSDDEIVNAAGMPIADIFEKFGEPYFRDGERRVIKRLMDENAAVIATGGGAVTSTETADLIWRDAVSIWLHADVDTLYKRTAGNKKRPLLNNDNPKDVLKNLAEKRNPIYKKADIAIDTAQGNLREILDVIIDELDRYLEQ
jgi:shikimate kinase